MKGSNQEILSEINSFKSKVDYIDVRIVDYKGTLITFNNRGIDDVTKPVSFQGLVRAFHQGGWGFSSFNSLEKVAGSIESAIRNVKKVKFQANYKLAEGKKVVDKVVIPEKNKKHLKVALDEKIKLLTKYNELAWKKSKYIVSSGLRYGDDIVQNTIICSNGTVIEEEKVHVYSRFSIITSFKDVMESFYVKLADNSFDELLGKESDVIKATEIADSLCRAPVTKSGKYTVILSPDLGGVFAHEAFGHLSEADNVYQDKDLAKLMKIGRRFGSPLVTIVDDPGIPGLRGSYKYDDEGTLAVKTVLLDKGVLAGRLHSKETAGKMEEVANGHGRAQGAMNPIPRMGVTYIENGTSKFTEMLKNTEKGLYCINWLAGNTDHENFTFTAGYAREINNGKLGKIVRNVKLTGNLFDTLKNIDMVGDDLRIEGGTCGKEGQLVPQSDGAPHIRIKNMMVVGG